MKRIPHRLIHFQTIAPMVAMLWLIAACSPRPAWSPDEIENSKHFSLSLEASRKAARLAHKADPDVPQFSIEEINRYQKTALKEARLVTDAVLDKAHPELKQHFRSEYQQGLELILKSYEVPASSESAAPSSSQISLQASGVALLERWTKWFDAHHPEFKFPRQTSTQLG